MACQGGEGKVEGEVATQESKPQLLQQNGPSSKLLGRWVHELALNSSACYRTIWQHVWRRPGADGCRRACLRRAFGKPAARVCWHIGLNGGESGETRPPPSTPGSMSPAREGRDVKETPSTQTAQSHGGTGRNAHSR